MTPVLSPCASISFVSSLRPRRALSASARRLNTDILRRFEAYRSLVLAVTCRLLACRLRTLQVASRIEYKVCVGHGTALYSVCVCVCFTLFD